MGDQRKEAMEKLQNQKDKSRRDDFNDDDGDADDGAQSLEDAILEALQGIDDGETPNKLCTSDDNLAALVRGLESRDQLGAVGEAVAAQRGQDVDGADLNRSEVLAHCIKFAFEEAAPEEFDALRDARARQASEEI